MKIPGEDWSQYRNGASLDPRGTSAEHTESHPINKELLALHTIDEYPGLERVLGHNEAAKEMAGLLGSYVLAGELNQFEADLIATLSILGNVATNALNENERLRGAQDN